MKKFTDALEQLKKQIQKEAARLEEEMSRVLSKLEEVESELAVETREVYQRVVKHKGEDGMASSEGGCCGGCHQQLTGKMLSQLMAGNVAMCRSCGRLLYESETNS